MEENKKPTPETTQKVATPSAKTSTLFHAVAIIFLLLGLFVGLVVYSQTEVFMTGLYWFIAGAMSALMFWGIHAHLRNQEQHLCNQEKILAELRKLTEKDKK